MTLFHVRLVVLGGIETECRGVELLLELLEPARTERLETLIRGRRLCQIEIRLGDAGYPSIEQYLPTGLRRFLVRPQRSSLRVWNSVTTQVTQLDHNLAENIFVVFLCNFQLQLILEVVRCAERMYR